MLVPPLHKFTALAGVLLLCLLSTLRLHAQDSKSQAGDPVYAYTLTITDRIRVVVFQEDDLVKISRVDASGNINLPLVGDVRVAGMTVNEAQRAVEQAYRDGRYLRNPQVTISIEEYAPREVSIQGQVKAPGRYVLPIEATFSVVDLVTKAGGFTDIAKGTEVKITRTSADGKQTTYVINVEGLIRGSKSGKAKEQGFLLQPGDIVYVPERII